MSRLIYTDGACSPNPGIGGWGAVVLSTHTYQPMYFLSGALPETTNNEMELMAAVASVASTPVGSPVTVVTDSKYVCDSFNSQLLKWSQNGWKIGSGHPIKNKELWQYLYHVAKQRKVDMLWIKGHSGDLYNEIADCLAVSARMSLVEGSQGPKVDESFFPDLSYFEATSKFLGKGTIHLSKSKEFMEASEVLMGVDLGAAGGDETKVGYFQESSPLTTKVDDSFGLTGEKSSEFIKTLMKQPILKNLKGWTDGSMT